MQTFSPAVALILPAATGERRAPSGSLPVDRPLPWLCAAVVAGSLAGASAGRPERSLFALALLSASAWLGWRCSSPLGTLRARYGRTGSLGFLFAIFALSAYRAHEVAGSFAGAPLHATGRWVEVANAGERVIGKLDGSGEALFEIPARAVEPGALLRIEAEHAPRLDARGPYGEPRAIQRVEPDELRALAPRPRSAWSAIQEPLSLAREAMVARIATWRDPLARGLVAASLCGERSFLDPELGDLFTRTGTFHLIAISGQHVCILAALLIWPAGAVLGAIAGSLLRLPRRLSGRLAGAVLMLAYVPLAGGSAPVARAALALSLAALSAYVPGATSGLGRRTDAVSLWSLALILECLLDPRAPERMSVRLSYAASLGLILGMRGPVTAGQPMSMPAPFLLPVNRFGHKRSPWVVVLWNKACKIAGSALQASVLAVIATTPFTWNELGECSPIGVVATALCLPLFGWLLVAGWIELGLSQHCSSLEGISGPACRVMVFLLQACDALPGTPLPLPPRPAVFLIAAALLFFAALRHQAVVFRRMCAAAWGATLLPWAPSPAGLEVHALDVGHGTCVVLRAPGTGTWIFDSGSRDRPRVARSALAPLLARWETTSPVVVLSHPDRDHALGLPWVVERYPPRLWLGALPPLLDERLAHTVPRVDLASPGRIEIAEDPSGRMQGFLLRGTALEGNEGSRGLSLSWSQGPAVGPRILLCGDAEGTGLGRLLEEGWIDGPTDLLLLPHHGSETALLGPLLEASDPDRIWISSPSDPPLAEELDRLARLWSCTGIEGPLSARFLQNPCDE